MTNDQKRQLANLVLFQAGNLIEYHTESLNELGIDPGEAAKQLTVWLAKLPGNSWDNRLPQPKK
jgi:hypothetical protein